MSKHSRSRSTEYTDVELNLIKLGLLDRPKTGNSQSTKLNQKGSEGITTMPALPHLSSAQEQGTPASFKQSSISKGTLGRNLPNAAPKQSRANALDADTFTEPVRTERPSQRPQESRPPRLSKMLNNDRARSRRERTFVGGQCAACEELLEHTLRGERVLQFSCGHVAHEACFYEYIKDTESQFCPTCNAPLGLDSSRGGSILDLSKLSNMVRSIVQPSDNLSTRTSSTTPVQWDYSGHNEEATSTHDTRSHHSGRESMRELHDDPRDSERARIERLGLASQHSRTNSGNASSGDYQLQENTSSRRHDYDVHAMETSVVDHSSKDHWNASPCPIVSVRSEFPTLTRSQNQQSLTCLVTVEVPEAKWRFSQHDEQSALMSLPMPPSKHRNTSKPAQVAPQVFIPVEPPHVLEQRTIDLQLRVDNWHGLEFARFGKLRLHDKIRVGKDLQSWQELECYLFGEMLICVKGKKGGMPPITTSDGRSLTRCTLKGSILIKRHLKEVQAQPSGYILTMNLSVSELPTFHLQFQEQRQLETWRQALLELHLPESLPTSIPEFEQDTSGTEDEEYLGMDPSRQGVMSVSSQGRTRSVTTAPTEYSSHQLVQNQPVSPSLHTPLDIVVVIPVSSSMQGLKISLLKDTLRFLVNNLGERDRMGLVTFGSQQGGVPLVGMTTKRWAGWNKVFSSIRPVGQKSLRADVVEGANVAVDLLMQRKAANPLSTILLISDSSTTDSESVNFVVSRAEAANIGIYSFGLGLTHKPDSMVELSSRTKASYVYVKDWMMLRECVAGCLGSLQSVSHQNAKLRLRLPEGSPAKFVKISGALQTNKRATGRDAEAILGDLRFGDKRDILVQLVIEPDTNTQEQLPQDHWESLVSGLEALGGSGEIDESRVQSIEEVALLQADLFFTESAEDTATQSTRPSLLTITLLPAPRRSKHGRPMTPPIPPHPSIVQRRMELLTSDMLTRALGLVTKQQHDRAHHLLTETRTILKGLAKGGLPPLPPSAGSGVSKRNTPPAPLPKHAGSSRTASPDAHGDHHTESERGTPIARTSGVDHVVMNALDADIESSLEWISHPAVFSRDSRKAVLQAIGIISSQRAYTFRTASESIWANRVANVRRLTDAARDWKEVADESLVEEQ